MKALFEAVSRLIDAAVYYISAAVALLVSNKYLMAGSLFLLLTFGRSFNIGKLLSYRSK